MTTCDDCGAHGPVRQWGPMIGPPEVRELCLDCEERREAEELAKLQPFMAGLNQVIRGNKQ